MIDDEERGMMFEVYYLLNEVAHEYGNEADFGEWKFDRKVEKKRVEISVVNEKDGRWGYIVVLNGFAINGVNFDVLKDFLEWLGYV